MSACGYGRVRERDTHSHAEKGREEHTHIHPWKERENTLVSTEKERVKE